MLFNNVVNYQISDAVIEKVSTIVQLFYSVLALRSITVDYIDITFFFPLFP
jgi:hypothetical protein